MLPLQLAEHDVALLLSTPCKFLQATISLGYLNRSKQISSYYDALVCVHSDKVCFMREGYDGLYMFPGGRVALEQEPVQAAVKYLQRQTGLHGLYV